MTILAIDVDCGQAACETFQNFNTSPEQQRTFAAARREWKARQRAKARQWAGPVCDRPRLTESPKFISLSLQSQEAVTSGDIWAERFSVSGNFLVTNFLHEVSIRDGQSLETIGCLDLNDLPYGFLAELAGQLWAKVPITRADYLHALDELGYSVSELTEEEA